MRIIHFADLHVGVENYSRPDPETGLTTRLLDFLRALDQVVDYAMGEGADLVLLAGDTYKSRDPSQTQQREFAKRLAKLSAAGIPVFLLVGNHDLPNALGRATAIDIFDTLEVPKLYVGDKFQTYRVATPSGPLQVTALPWPKRSTMLSREDTRGLSIEQINGRIREIMAAAVRRAAESLDPGVPAILTGHVTVHGATVGSERNMMLGQDHALEPSDIHLPQFDYIALGHIHKHQVLRDRPLMVYAGSLQRVDFGEENDPKGFCVVDLDPSQPAGRRLTGYRFQEVDARAFTTVDVNVPRESVNPTADALRVIGRHVIADAIVRVIINLTTEQQTLLIESEIRDALSEAHHVAGIKISVDEERRTRLGADVSRGLTPLKALALYLDSRSVEGPRKEKLLNYAKDLMAEDIIDEGPTAPVGDQILTDEEAAAPLGDRNPTDAQPAAPEGDPLPAPPYADGR